MIERVVVSERAPGAGRRRDAKVAGERGARGRVACRVLRVVLRVRRLTDVRAIGRGRTVRRLGGSRRWTVKNSRGAEQAERQNG